MVDFFELETPALLVDIDQMSRNLDRVADYARSHEIALRPHIKTHKSPLLSREQLDRGAAGLTCATPYEAEVMSEACDDLLVMYPPVGQHRAMRLAQLAQRVRLTVALDSETAARDIGNAAQHVGSDVRVLIEIDVGMHRVGVQSADDATVLARRVTALPRLEVVGIAFYPGHIRGPVTEHAPQLAELGKRIDEARSAFERAKIPMTVVSAGSTPTLWRTHEIGGVTEMRPGTYIFNDRTTADIGACTLDDCALTVLATVVSTAVPGQAVVDAGAKALGREPIRGTSSEGFASVAGRPDVVVKSMSEEHGILDLSRTSWRPKVGERLQLVPNHVCIVVHLADVVYGVRDAAVVSSWPVAARGRGQPVLADSSELAVLRTGLGR
jgi:D-serine deaminase-like pyridoxal phosphate-dependent protein